MSASKPLRRAKKPKPPSNALPRGPSARATIFSNPRNATEISANGNSASCRAQPLPICAAKAPANLSSWIFLDTRSAASPSANLTKSLAEQIADYVARGIDMMDCVLPTRAARHACLYTSEGRVLIKNARYSQDQRPIDPKCTCSVCRRYSRAYLRHLFAAGELTAAILATHHNIHFYLDIMRQIREAIEFGNLANFSSEMHARYAAGPA